MSDTVTYNGSFVYQGDSGNMQLDYVLHPEGMTKMQLDGPRDHFFIRDHLGNTRVTLTDKNGDLALSTAPDSGEVLQIRDYYPFGLEHPGGFTQDTDNKYLYNGKELQSDQVGAGGLGWYDYGARMYDPAIGKWHIVDLLIGKYDELSS